MKPLTLDDVRPEPAKFSLTQVPEKQFTLRPISVLDRRWMRESFSESEMAEIFNPDKIDFEKIGRIVYHQLTPEDQQFFKKRKVEVVDEMGNSATLEMGGVILFYSLVTGLAEQITIIQALTKTFGVSSQMIEMASQSESKKKSKPIGRASSISSAPSTDGRPTTSSDLPKERSDGG